MTWQDFATIASLTVSVIGVGVTLWQVVSAKNASVAARDAARDAQADVARLTQVIRAEQLLAKIRLLMETIRNDRELKRAADLAWELHELLARSLSNGDDSTSVSPEMDGVLAMLRGHYQALRDAEEIKRIDKELKRKIISECLEIQEKLLRSGERGLRKLLKGG